MKELVVISGKGGTGKTSIVSALVGLIGNIVVCDCDVDAANLQISLGAKLLSQEKFIAGKKAYVVIEKCTGCSACVHACRFEAIHITEVSADFPNDICQIDPLACEGCGICEHFCPYEAIHMLPASSGMWCISDTRWGPIVHAELRPGEENSGKLVAKVKQVARKLLGANGSSLLIVDGPPGVGCPVIASVTGADLVLVVTEPTPSGAHDMGRALDLCAHFRIPALVCINKSDLFPEQAKDLEKKAESSGSRVIGLLPYDPDLVNLQFHTACKEDVFPPAWLAGVKEMWSVLEEYLAEAQAS